MRPPPPMFMSPSSFASRFRIGLQVLVATTLVAAAATAHAQNLTDASVTLDIKAKDASGTERSLTTDQLRLYLNKARCQCNEALNVSLSLTTQGVTDIGEEEVTVEFVWGKDCNNATVTCKSLGGSGLISGAARTASVQVPIKSLFEPYATTDDSCAVTEATSPTLWAILTKDGKRLELVPSRSMRLHGRAPATPTIASLVAGDGSLTVMPTLNNDVATPTVRLQALCDPAPRQASEAAFTVCKATIDQINAATAAAQPGAVRIPLATTALCSGAAMASAGSLRIGGLSNGVETKVALVAIDEAGNVSAPSPPMAGVPLEALGFVDVYEDATGEELGGCGVAGPGGGGLGFLMLVGLLGFLRRSGRRFGWRLWALLLPALAFAAPAQAASVAWIEEGSKTEQVGWSFEAGLGFYRPEIDKGLDLPGGASAPYETVFGNQRLLMPQLWAGRMFGTGVGSLTLALGLGYARATGNGLVAGGTQRSADESTLTFVPMSLGVKWALDDPAPESLFMLSPYVKAGLDYFLWNASGAGKDRTGATLGAHAGVGLALMLDAIDRTSAKSLRNESGVLQSSFFVEITRHEVTGLGTGEGLNLSDWVVTIGVAAGF